MKYIIPFLFAISLHANDYDGIVKRNAFNLSEEYKSPSTLPPLVKKPVYKLYLTGITSLRGRTYVYIHCKETLQKFITLSNNKTVAGIKLVSVDKNNKQVVVNNNGVVETLSFNTHRLPTTVTLPVLKPSVLPVPTKASFNKAKEEKEKKQSNPKPNVVTVPSRVPKVDPRIIQKGLEYIDKVEDKEKKEYILQRLERLQSGQQKLDNKIDNNERRRQYDERRRDRK